MSFELKTASLKTPCYVISEELLIKNLEILKDVSEKSGCKILLAQKAFSMYSLYPLIGKYLDGTTASGLFEAKLGFEEMKKETHIFSPAYSNYEIDEIFQICDYVVFNSLSQWNKFKNKGINKSKSRDIKFGIRINPEFSTQDHGIYDPCSKFSRLGITKENLENELKNNPDLLTGITGFHFHTLCEQNSDDLIKTIDSVENNFGGYLEKLDWINFGGGHHITREDYDKESLIDCIKSFKEKYKIKIYLEPGEAVALNAGFLVASVVDIINNGKKIAILDTSAACHMPDVLEMPYRPNIINTGLPGDKKFEYRLGGSTCLAGDIIGDYSFDNELKLDDKLIFCDMAHYSMVKNNTFNGINLPDIIFLDKKNNYQTIKTFGFNDFKMRLS